MSKNQTIQEFDENFFSSIAVPKVKDYSRLSSSPSRDQPCNTSYFESHFPNLECDTPVKMRIPTAYRESGDALPTATMEHFLSSSSSSETTVHVEERESAEKAPVKQIPANHMREPLKIVPNESATVPVKSYGENQLIEGLEKLTMFAPKEPEERLAQRRRSEQKKKEAEEKKRRSVLPAAPTVNRARSASTHKRSVSKEPSTAPMREPSIPRSRHTSVTRTISAPVTDAKTGVVTRAMAARAAESSAKPMVRRSVMPLKIAQKTPAAAIKTDSAPGSGDRSRDRTRRTNTTGTSSLRRSVIPGRAVAVSTPVAPPRRSASATKSSSASKMTPKTRPIATANRSSILRMNFVKPTAPPASLAADSDVQQKRMAARPTVPVATTSRIRQPLRVNPGTPSSMAKKPALPTSGQRMARLPLAATRARSVDRDAGAQQPSAATGPSTPAAKTSRADVFNRLSTPKATTTPSRVSHANSTSGIRKSAVRPVPSYVYNVNKGMPSAGGLHGIRAPSKDRSTQKGVSTAEPSKQ